MGIFLYYKPHRRSQSSNTVIGIPRSLALCSITARFCLIISRIHHKKHQFKGKLVMTLQFLEQFGHQHGILTTGNTDCYLISRLHQLIIVDSPGKSENSCLWNFLRILSSISFRRCSIASFSSSSLFSLPDSFCIC